MERNWRIVSKINWLQRWKMLIVNLIIALFYLKLDKFYCIRARNYWKMIGHVLFLCSYKKELLLIRQIRINAKRKKYISWGKEKAAEYYIKNKEVIKQKANSKLRNFSEKEKEIKREYGRRGMEIQQAIKITS